MPLIPNAEPDLIQQNEWGFTVPRDKKKRLINARGESVHEKRSFKDAFEQRRCLILADGYYEWQKQPNGPKQPYRVQRADDEPFAFAGLWNPAKGYEWCFKFATLTVVGDNIKLTLALKPLQPGEELVGETLRDLVERAQEHVTIDMVYADSEFCTVETMRSLDELGVNYVIPSPKNPRIKREFERMRQDIEVHRDHVRYGPIADGRTKKPRRTNLILLPSTKDETQTVAFTTNLDIDDSTEAARREAKGLVNRYARRWGIENSYKTIKDFLAWTTSKEFVVRFFYFGFAVLLYNTWLLVDLLVQLSLDIEHRYKPRVTAKRILILARKQLEEPD